MGTTNVVVLVNMDAFFSATRAPNDMGDSEIDASEQQRIMVRSCAATMTRSLEPATGITTLVENQAVVSAII